jgi:ssDNA-binding Zn-finger/Zn-ribbon topoisomerase 1
MTGNKYTKDKPICPICGQPMNLDDIDYNFDGNQDNYWVCNNENCNNGRIYFNVSAFQKVRYGKVVKTEFNYEIKNVKMKMGVN